MVISIIETIIWGTERPTKIREHIRDSPKVNVWCAVTPDGLIGPYFHDASTVNGDRYLDMLEEFFPPNLSLRLQKEGFFQQDGAPCHFTLRVREFLQKHFGDRWISRAGLILWPGYTPDLTAYDFWLWGILKERIYAQKIRDLRHLRETITQIARTITPKMCSKASHRQSKDLNFACR